MEKNGSGVSGNPGKEIAGGNSSSNVNGWETIARALKQKKLLQKDLAEHLKVSQPAITQFKQGTIKFSRRQLAEIAEFLEFSPETAREFYAAIIDARFAWEPLVKEAVSHESSR